MSSRSKVHTAQMMFIGPTSAISHSHNNTVVIKRGAGIEDVHDYIDADGCKQADSNQKAMYL